MNKLDIENIKKNYSILDIAVKLGLKINNHNKTICPFHNDNNPSLSFNTKDNYYHCFSCGASGDNIKLVKEILNCDFKEAIEFIIGKEYKSLSNEYNISRNTEKKTYNNDYSKIYKTFIDLLNNEDAIEYLNSRCITKKQIIKYNIKNIPKDTKEQYKIVQKLLKYFNGESLIKSGIISKGKTNNNLYLFHYKHRLIIPYFDIDGTTIISIQGRAIDGEIKPKYLFNKNSKDSIYNIHTLSNIKDIIVCEGVIDALSLERLGYCSIAVSGASKINILEQYKILENYNIYSFSDNDEAGKKLIKKIYKFDNYRGAFSINQFSNEKCKDINELLTSSKIKKFTIDNEEFYYFEIKNDKICILDYYIFSKNELKYIKKSKDFIKSLTLLTIDKKILTEKEYKIKYGDFN